MNYLYTTLASLWGIQLECSLPLIHVLPIRTGRQLNTINRWMNRVMNRNKLLCPLSTKKWPRNADFADPIKHPKTSRNGSQFGILLVWCLLTICASKDRDSSVFYWPGLQLQQYIWATEENKMISHQNI